MVRRSVLFTPGDQPEMMRKAGGTGADVLVFDLEDAVAPESKDEGRTAVRNVLSDPEFDPDAEVCVRVNADETAADRDLDVVLDPDPEYHPDSVMLPKVDDAEDVRTLEYQLAEHDADDLPVIAILESARGILHAEAIADADATGAVAFGAEDLAADVGANRTAEGTEVLYAREHVVLAAGAAGVDAIDTVYTDIRDTEGLREEAAFAKDLGYDGKMAIHPAQVDPINEAYTPSPDRVEWAEKVLTAREKAEGENRGVFRVDDQMIDAPLIAQAERVMKRARAAGITDE